MVKYMLTLFNDLRIWKWPAFIQDILLRVGLFTAKNIALP